jgi:type I protein arginine methyltransferase
MGYFLLYESMLDSVLWARDKYLVKGGKMLPDKVQMYVAAIEDGQYKQEKRNFWNDVYSTDMSCLTSTVLREPLVDKVPSQAIISSTAKICELDLCTMKPSDVEFTCGYKVTMNFNEKCHGLVAWWDSEFSNLKNPVMLSTSPYSKCTHWK